MQKKNSKRSDDWHSSAKVEKSLLVMSLKYTPVKHIVLDLSNMRKNHTSLNYTGQESKNTIHTLHKVHIFLSVYLSKTQRERERQTQTDRDRETETDRQRETERVCVCVCLLV